MNNKTTKEVMKTKKQPTNEDIGTTIEIKFKLSRENYHSIIEMAGYGVGYWASFMSSEDNGCHFTEDETQKKFFITPKMVEKAVAELYTKRSLNSYYMDAIDMLVNQGCSGDCGSDISDAIIQQACFQEVIYG